MTGWRGDEGGQGGWQQPSNDPYGYHPDVRGWDTGPHDTAAYPRGANPYQTGGFPAQGGYGADPYELGPEQYGPDQPGYDPFQPYPDFSPSPPAKRSKLPMVLGVLAIVIIVGAVVTIVLINRNKEDSAASPPPSSTERQAPPPGKSSERPPPSSGGPGGPGGQDGWQTVDNLDDAGLTYQVPPDWKLSNAPRPSGLDVDFTGTAEYGIYDCDGESYVRSFATSGDVQSKRGADLDLDKTVSDFAKSFATSYFKDTAKVDIGRPEKTEIGGQQAVKLTAPVTPQVSVPKCEASKGEIAIVGLLLEADDEPAGVAMLVVVSDVDGGPDDPKPLSADVAQDILASVRPS